MADTTTAAIKMMAIALPTMFLVIGFFIIATKILHAAFPARVKDD